MLEANQYIKDNLFRSCKSDLNKDLRGRVTKREKLVVDSKQIS
jgi:hypothetical protein